MSVNAYVWEEHCLMVVISVSGKLVSFLCNHCTQEDFFEAMTNKWTSFPEIMCITSLTEDSFEILEPQYSKAKRLIEGE